MDREDRFPSQEPKDAEEIFEEIQRLRGAGELIEIEAYCRRYPDFAHALRYLETQCLGAAQQAGETPADIALQELVASENAERPLNPGLAASSGAPARPERDARLRSGSLLGRYRILAPVGEGGFSVVYKAEQLEPVRREVALKTIKLGMDTREILARFEAERQSLALMSNSGIARVFDAGQTPWGAPFFVMEYVQGAPITSYCDQRRLGLTDRIALFVAVCHAIQHAHHKGIIHRDLKPSNILVAEEGGKPVPKVIDFGIAKATGQRLTAATIVTGTGQIIGTPAYMSPEQASGEVDIDTRTDIYSLGVLLYELLVGVRPFELKRSTPAAFQEMQRTICEDEPPRPSTRIRGLGEQSSLVAQNRQCTLVRLARDLRGDLDWITARAIAKERARRYASALELAADLERHLRHEPVLAGPPGVVYRLRKFARRRRLVFSSIAVVIVLSGILGGAAFQVAEKRRQEEELNQSDKWLAEGRRILAEDVGPARVRLEELDSEHLRLRYSLASWCPIWERQAELEARRKAQEQRSLLESGYTQALSAFTEAINTAPMGSEPLTRARASIWGILDDLDNSKTGTISRSVLEEMMRFATGRRQTSDAPARIVITTDVPQTEVYCFRYELIAREARLLPLPFDPRPGQARVVGEPFLRVEKIWNRSLALLHGPEGSDESFQPGDKLLTVAGSKVGLPSELAEALSRVRAEEEIQLTLERNGGLLERRWIPFSKAKYGKEGLDEPLAPGRLISIRDQLGLSFEGYPLALEPSCRVGTTSREQPLEFALPEGSYLLVCRNEGHPLTRYPVAVPRFTEPGAQVRVEISFLAQTNAPAGFVLVPGSEFAAGGDAQAYQPLHSRHWVDDFCMGRHEVTFDEYLEFLNHPETLERLAASTQFEGEVQPLSAPAKQLAAMLVARGRGVQLLPKWMPDQRVLVERDGPGPGDGPWRSAYRGLPILGIPYVAMLEYADWRTRHAQDGWSYRLPTDIEWEKAARGADRRTYVWGDYLVWDYCWSFPGIAWRRPLNPASPGQMPLDESVYGVRDLEGSVEELSSPLNSGPLQSEGTIISRRGGSWERGDENFYRLATRNGIAATAASRQLGFRLVAVRRGR